MRVKDWKSPEAPYAYMQTPDGLWFGQHFWLYALSTVPAKVCLEWSGETSLLAPALTNAVWYLLAIGVALFGPSAPVGQRAALVALSGAGPVIWYLPWPGAEIFSWSLALIAVVTYRDRRYVWAGLAAGLAATQNPPVILLGGVAVLAALADRRWRVAVGAAAGTAVGLVPYAFFQYHFGAPNLIMIGAEYAGVRNLSWVRTVGFVTDFNQGLLPYLPVLVVGMLVGTVRMVYTRNRNGLLLVASGLGMALGTEVSHNWNSSCFGLQRYLVWMIPVAAGVAVVGIGGCRRMWLIAVAAVVTHTAIELAYERYKGLRGGELDHTGVAEWVLTYCPRLYWAEPEVFVERGQHRDGWPYRPADFPIVFAREDGTVSKMLLGPEDVEKVPLRFEVAPDFLAGLRQRAANESTLFYVHPPHGAVRERPPQN
jgi:hypothetical protein